MPERLATLIAVVIGGAITVTAETLRGKFNRRAQADDRATIRRLELEEIQRTTLLELQPALRDWVSVERRGQRMWIAALRETGKVGQLGDELDQAQLAAGHLVIDLRQRVVNQNVRDAIQNLTDAVDAVDAIAIDNAHGYPTDVDKMEQLGLQIVVVYRETAQHLGIVLRTYLE